MIHARTGDWDAFRRCLFDLLAQAQTAGEVAEDITIESAYVTGSLAYGEGTPGESDVDIVLGILPEGRYDAGAGQQLRQFLDAHSTALAAATKLPVTDAHIVEVVADERAPHRAMELQHHGHQLARQHGGEPPEMVIFDVFGESSVRDARQA